MSVHERLLAETDAARAEFLSIPLIGHALDGDVTPALYADFLAQAYHHVSHTCPLLSFAAARTGDNAYRDALYTYLEEERGHDEWILADIAAIGGVEQPIAPARAPCRAMVGYAYYAIEWISPYALLGMVHVLEGMSALLAGRAASALRAAFGVEDQRGFSYLVSHGALDVEHTRFFRDLVDGLDMRAAATPIIDCATMMYWLYGNIFRDLDQRREGAAHATRG